MSEILAMWTSGALCGKLCPHFKAKPARCEHPEAPTQLRLVWPMHWDDTASPERSEYCLSIVPTLPYRGARFLELYKSPFKASVIVKHPEPLDTPTK